MKILILSNSDMGLFKFRKELLDELVKHYKIYISVPNGEFVDALKSVGCRVVINRLLVRRGTNPLQDLKLIRYYNQLVKEIDPKIVLTYTVKPNIYGGLVCGKNNIPYVANITGLGTSLENGGILERITLALYRIGLRKARKIFFQNTINLEYMLRHNVVKGNWGLLPGSGVNIEQHCYEEYPKNSNPLIFSTIGRIMRDKGIDEILEAARIIKKEYPNVHFRLVGNFDEAYEETVMNAVNEGIIEYIAQQKNIHPIITESHAILHASYHEGMSNVLLESASTGRPVIATNVPGCAETYDEGISGIGFAPKNKDDLIRALEEFIKLPYERKVAMGIAGRRKMEKEFDRSIVVKEYMDEIER